MQFVFVDKIGIDVPAGIAPLPHGAGPIGDVGIGVAGGVGTRRALQAAIGEIGGQRARWTFRGVGDHPGDIVLRQKGVGLGRIKALVSWLDGMANGANAGRVEKGFDPRWIGFLRKGQIAFDILRQNLQKGRKALSVKGEIRRQLPDKGASRSPSASGPEAKKLASGSAQFFRRLIWVTNCGPLTENWKPWGVSLAQRAKLAGF